LWAEQRRNGYVIADFASALGMMNEEARAEQLFKEGLEITRSGPAYLILLEDYSIFLQQQERYGEVIQVLRKLHTAKPYHYHVKRRFARCLFEEAKRAMAGGEYIVEDACINEAIQLLSQLIQKAPADEWAQHCMQIVRGRDYTASLIV
jgi:tetratricopeptide (TPR) repeat protein